MNLVVDDAIEVKQATKTTEEKRRELGMQLLGTFALWRRLNFRTGQILLKGDNVSLIQALQWLRHILRPYESLLREKLEKRVRKEIIELRRKGMGCQANRKMYRVCLTWDWPRLTLFTSLSEQSSNPFQHTILLRIIWMIFARDF